MCGRILVLGCVFLIAVMQSGCIGLIASVTGECKNETPSLPTHPYNKVTKVIKEEFLKDWGTPDEIISTSENKETWIYNRKLWCGVIPIVVLPVPLVLPVCNGFDRIEFHGNEAKNLHTRHVVPKGFLVVLIKDGWVFNDPACRHPLPPSNGLDSDATKPAAQVTP